MKLLWACYNTFFGVILDLSDYLPFQPPEINEAFYRRYFLDYSRGIAEQPVLSTRKRIGFSNGISDNAVTLMITFELFDSNCSLTARSSVPYVIHRIGKFRNRIIKSVSWLPEMFGYRSKGVDASIRLMENFPTPSRSHPLFYLARIQLSPSLPILAARVVMVPRVTSAFALFFQRHAILAFFTLMTVFTLLGSCCITSSCFLYFTLLRLKRKTAAVY